MRKLALVALGAVMISSPTAAAENIMSDALQCSKAALRQYALFTSEPAEKIADVAFDKCAEKWRKAAEAAGENSQIISMTAQAQANCIKKLGTDACPPPKPYSFYFMEATKRTFKHDAVIEVFDIRAGAAQSIKPRQ